MKQNKVVLGYYNIRGLAERVRHLLEYCKIPYTQHLYKDAQGRKQWFQNIKPELILNKNPAANLPYLLDGQKYIFETDAIITYIIHKADKLELLGRNVEEKVWIATLHGVYMDFQADLVKLTYFAPKERPFEDCLSEACVKFQVYLRKFEGILGNKEYMCGQLTWIDFVLADILQGVWLLQPKLAEKFPFLKKYQEKVWSLPELQEYFKSQKYSERPIWSYYAVWK